MKYPSTLQYIETLANAQGLFNSLRGVTLIGDGYCSGNFGTVFKIQTDDGVRALKCFTRAQHGRLSAYRRIAEAISPSQYIVDYRYVEDEIYVFNDSGEDGYFPVVLMDWVDGVTLTTAVDIAVPENDREQLKALSDKFYKLSAWLLEQTFAHNDLKPDNIMVRSSDAELVLIDYDGMFVESMTGETAREFGTEPFQSPLRKTAKFDRNVDNYSIAYIRRALSLLAVNPKRYSPNVLVDFTPDELSQIGDNETIFGSSYQYLGSAVRDIMIFRKAERYGFVKKGGVLLIDAVFDAVLDFSDDGLAAVCNNEKWGYIDSYGVVVIPQIYDECTEFSQGRAAVRVGHKWGYINLSGERISRFVYDNAWSFRQGLALVFKSEKYGFVGLDGKVAISLKFDFAYSFTPEGVACVSLDYKYGYINQRGRWWERPIYDYAQSFRDGKAAVELRGREFFIEFSDDALGPHFQQ